MAERPILFSGPLVRAILDGRKTETRRLVTPGTSIAPKTVWDHRLPGTPCVPGWANLDFDAHLYSEACDRDGHTCFCCCLVDGAPDRGQYIHVPAKDHETRHRVYCRVEPGDVLWVRETWRVADHLDGAKPSDLEEGATVKYVADDTLSHDNFGLFAFGRGRPSLHMPKWASRIRLRVTEVGAERLQAIDEAGAIAEGIGRITVAPTIGLPRADRGFCGKGPKVCADVSGVHREAFADLWDSIYSGEHAWAANPWVWRIRFEIAEVKR